MQSCVQSLISVLFTIHPKERFLNVVRILIEVSVSVNFNKDIAHLITQIIQDQVCHLIVLVELK